MFLIIQEGSFHFPLSEKEESFLIHLKILEVRNFMEKLLLEHSFDNFLLLEASIHTGNLFFIDGHRNPDFYTKEEYESLTGTEYALTPWKQLRHFCYEIIKGTKTPSQFKITFQLSKKDTAVFLKQTESSFLLEEIEGLFFHLKYDGSSLSCITGTSYRIFSLDKSLDRLWDQKVQSLLNLLEISFDFPS